MSAPAKTAQDILAILEPWQSALIEAEAGQESLMAFTGQSVDAPLMRTLSGLMDFATQQAAKLVGCDQWALDWWWQENEFGKRGMGVQVGDAPLRPMTTLAEYAQVMVMEATCSK